MTSFFDFFFESQPSCPTHWVFKDEDLREDFRDCCRELKCLPSMRAAQEGEDEDDKAKRKAKEKLDAAEAASRGAAGKAAAASVGGRGAGGEEFDFFDRSAGKLPALVVALLAVVGVGDSLFALILCRRRWQRV